jgi:large subunit ribosomal protein L25
MASITMQVFHREEIALEVEDRQEQGTSAVGKLRRENGMLPGVLYGHKQPPFHLKTEALSLERAMGTGGSNAIFLVRHNGSDERAIVREIQYHKVHGQILHFDLLRIDPEEVLRVSVPVTATGLAAGVRSGGALQQTQQTVEIECPVAEMPSRIEVDVTSLEVGDSVRVSDLLEHEGRIVSEPVQTILTVLAPRLVEDDLVTAEVAIEGEEGEAAEEGAAAEGEGTNEGA